uniref:Fibrinogen alpha chain n=1 Tax=Sphaeramia orbicularis TaxID=375764 RepID=A0A672YL76_9TELE
SFSSVVDPRGARPVVPNTRSEKCATQKEWPFCTTDEWGPKCPSGCRIHGLLEKYDHGFLKSIEKIRSLLDQNQAKHRSANQVSKQTYDFLKEKLTLDAGNDNNYFDLAQNLRRRITEMKIKIDGQLRVLAALKDKVRDQVADMKKLEVDIDIKLRSCKGSCKGHTAYELDHESYVTLDKQMAQLDSLSGQSIETVGTLHVMKSREMKDAVVDTTYKSRDSPAAAQQTEDLFSDVNNVQLVLELEGSINSPATISKDTGTTYSPSSSSTSSNSSCTRRVQTTIVHTSSGPVERTQEVVEGGPECQSMTDLTKGGSASLFPSLTSKTLHITDTKGSLTGDSKTTFADPFTDAFDLGGFMTDNTEDDTPDFHARSVKSLRIERQADYVGKDCVAALQHHLNGEKNGLFKIKPGGDDSSEVVEVYCQQEGLMGGWVLVQQRDGGAVSFNRSWAEYRQGFGSVDAQGGGEVWLGNQNLHLLTNQGETLLKVELEDWEGGVASAEYTIRVGSEGEGYPLQVSGYTGDAGDALVAPKTDTGSYISHNGMKFSTFDKDNDQWEENCAEMYGGGWWFNNCRAVHLNGIYYKGLYDPEKNTPYEIENGVVWVTYKPENYSLKTVRMWIRSAAF